jgi:diguanylate cyclase
MSELAGEHERTMALAEIAFGQIKSLRQPATPRNYEIWYTYASGASPSLNQSINETLDKNGNLRNGELEQFCSSFISPVRYRDKVGNTGSQLVTEINQVLEMIDAAAGSANSFTDSLASVTDTLSGTKDDKNLRDIVEALVAAADQMKQDRQALEQGLNTSKDEIEKLHESLEAVRNASLTDPLTSLANRKHFDDTLNRTLAESRERNEPLSLLMTDIDHFKKFNDNWGHLTGDHVLRLVAFSIKQHVKEQRMAARYGGDEFAIILPNTMLLSALTIADNIRRTVMSKRLTQASTDRNLGWATISLGCATAHIDDTMQSLIARADACLYAAKRSGRNRAICETDPEFATAEGKVALSL